MATGNRSEPEAQRVVGSVVSRVTLHGNPGLQGRHRGAAVHSWGSISAGREGLTRTDGLRGAASLLLCTLQSEQPRPPETTQARIAGRVGFI